LPAATWNLKALLKMQFRLMLHEGEEESQQSADNLREGIANDRGGFGLKQELVTMLRAAGHELIDFGAHYLSPTEWPQ
jgi:uncharacterized protein YgfB (UPF0149 family)